MALFSGDQNEQARDGATLLAVVLMGWMPTIEDEPIDGAEGDAGG